MWSPLVRSTLLAFCLFIGLSDRIGVCDAAFGSLGGSLQGGFSRVTDAVTKPIKSLLSAGQGSLKVRGQSSKPQQSSASGGSSKDLLAQFQKQSKSASDGLTELSDRATSALSGAAAAFAAPAAKLADGARDLLKSFLSLSLLIRGKVSAPRAGYNESFTLWFDPTSGATRVDFNDGATSTYLTPLKDGVMQRVEVRQERWEGRLKRRCAQAPPGKVPSAGSLLSAFPDLSLFSFAGILKGDVGDSQRWLHSVSGGAGELGAAPGESLSFHQELLFKQGIAGIPVPYKYSMSVDSSLLGESSDGFKLQYDQVQVQSHESSVFQPDLSNCDVSETLDPSSPEDAARLDPLKEFTASQRDPKYDTMLSQFKISNALEYLDNLEEAIRKNLFVQSARFVDAINRSGATFRVGLNFLADKLDSELALLRGANENEDAEAESGRTRRKRSAAGNLPKEFDWRERGAVTPVKFQGLKCSSCWAFAVAGALEGALVAQGKELQQLSEQALVDCGHETRARGCKGTWPERAYDYVKARGLPADHVYGPYNGTVLTCRADVPPTARITGHKQVPAGDFAALQEAIKSSGPAVVVMDAKRKTFTLYQEGVLQEDNCGKTKKDLDHAMVAVGWGESDGKLYLILKNSWTANWGQKGYIHVAADENTCGVLSQASQPVLD